MNYSQADSVQVKSGSCLAAHWPLIAGICVLFAILVHTLWLGLLKTNGLIIYSLDDAYIHMAVAKNFALNGVWGVTQYEFSSSVSSILWPLILSGLFLITGPWEPAAFILNVLFSTLTLVSIHFMLRRFNVTGFFAFITLVVAILLTPMVPLIFVGMEHSLQILLCCLFLYFSTLFVFPEQDFKGRIFLYLIILGPLVASVRYEGAFLVGASCITMAALTKRIKDISLILVLSATPIIVYGLISLYNDWPFIPGPIALKALPISIPLHEKLLFISVNAFSWVHTGEFNLIILICLFLLSVHILKKGRDTVWNQWSLITAIFLAYGITHLSLAPHQYSYRYNAVVMLIGIAVIGAHVQKLWDHLRHLSSAKALFICCAILVCFMLVRPERLLIRSAISLINTPQATANIYEQQYQMGLFLRQYYKGARVVMNDIGAMNYLGDVRIIDLEGLGTLQTFKAITEDRLTGDFIGSLSRSMDAKIGIVYPSWFTGNQKLPDDWRQVGSWTISNNIVCGASLVGFFEIRRDSGAELKANLSNFSDRLPKTVKQKGYPISR